MFGSNTIEIAIGIILVYILISTICTAIREGIESKLKTRAAYLERGIRELFKKDTTLANNFFNHPLINGLFNADYNAKDLKDKPGWLDGGGNLPSYIPSRNFAKALMDMAARGTTTTADNSSGGSPVITLDGIRANVAAIQNPYVQRVLLNAIDTAQGDINKAQANIEDWYNSSMDRVSGWYKRATQSIIFFIALFVVITLNVNTIVISNYLSLNDTARKVLVERATAMANDTAKRNLSYAQSTAELDSLSLPIGWAKGWDASGMYTAKSNAAAQAKRTAGNDGLCIYLPHSLSHWLILIAGWLATALAATLGAPFWFDMLNRMMVIRSTVKPHEKSLEEASEDRQPPPPAGGGGAAGGGGGSPGANGASGTANFNTTAANTDDIDGCDITATDLTGDDQLPASEGGVA